MEATLDTRHHRAAGVRRGMWLRFDCATARAFRLKPLLLRADEVIG
jgi:hypothetical protein